jgi:hypothetical protein
LVVKSNLCFQKYLSFPEAFFHKRFDERVRDYFTRDLGRPFISSRRKVITIVVFEVIIACRFKGTIHSLSINDIHLVRWHELILAMKILVPTLQVFRPIKPTDANVYMLHVECTHLQDLRFPVRETVKDWVSGYTMTDQDEVTWCNAFTSHCFHVPLLPPSVSTVP